MSQIARRQALLGLIAAPVLASGCSRQEIAEATEELSTDTLQNTRVGLRGFQIVSLMVGQRIILLPAPGVRVLGVALLATGIATILVIEYLDVELKRRTIQEELQDDERASIESSLAVEFQTENGLTESVALGPNQYGEPESSSATSESNDPN